VQTAEREVTVHESSVLWREDDRAGLRFVCSSGTYVRSLVAALGDAYCLELRRLAIGPFEVDGAWPGQGVPAPLDLAAAWARFAAVLTLDEQEAWAAAHGRPLAGRGLDGPVLLVDGAGKAVAVAAERDGALAVEVGLRG
jgi:tRNA pseudouridine55 synthase